MKWKTKNGREIEVEDMETSHIENSLNMMKRQGFIGPSTLAFYTSCERPRGDAARYAFEGEIDQILEAPVSEFIDVFEEELQKRNYDKDKKDERTRDNK